MRSWIVLAIEKDEPEVEKVALTLFPNPSNLSVTVSIDRKVEIINIIDMYGRMIETYVPEAAEECRLTIPTSAISNGCYIIKGSIERGRGCTWETCGKTLSFILFFRFLVVFFVYIVCGGG